MSLNGITRPGESPVVNPGEHSPCPVYNRVMLDVVGPDGNVKDHVEHEGNIMLTYGLNDLAERIATGGEASNWVSAMAVGTGTTAAASTQNALVASTGIVHLSQASMVGSDAGARTLQFNATFASDNPSGSAEIHEIGIFGTNAATAAGVARSVLGTDSVNKGASDTINATYQVIFSTA